MQREGLDAAGGGKLLVGFGSQPENGLHLAATADRPQALRALWTFAQPSAAAGLDVRGRSALHSAAFAAAIQAKAKSRRSQRDAAATTIEKRAEAYQAKKRAATGGGDAADPQPGPLRGRARLPCRCPRPD